MWRLLLLVGCTDGKAVTPAPRDDTGSPPTDTAGSDSVPPVDSDFVAEVLLTHDGCLIQTTWNVDADGDGFGGTSLTVCGWKPPPNATTDTSDCDDTRATIYPGAPGLYTSGRSEDCGESWQATTIEQVPTTSFWDSGEDDQSAWGVAVLDDVDGDGYPELAISDRYGPDRGGSVYVIPGPIDRGVSLADMAGSARSALRGVHDARDYVETVADAGDVDGDGYPDVLVGGFQANGLPGVVYLLRGPVPAGDVMLADAAQVFDGLYEGSELGRCIGPGDIDGDSLDDVVLSARSGDWRLDQRGEVYFLRGPATIHSLEDAAGTIVGEPSDYIGTSLVALGDLSGDGNPDFAFSANWDHGFIVTTPPVGRVAVADAAVDAVWDASGAWSSGYMIANALGDIDDDGYADVGFGTAGDNSFRILRGPVDGGAVIDLATASDTILWSTNHGIDSALGYATSLGDWDGDGHPDLAVANRYYTPEAHLSNCDGIYNFYCYVGAVFLLAGPITAPSINLEEEADRLENDTPWTDGNSSQFGYAMAGGADLDDDGFPDLVVGDPGADLAWVVFGGGQF